MIPNISKTLYSKFYIERLCLIDQTKAILIAKG